MKTAISLSMLSIFDSPSASSALSLDLLMPLVFFYNRLGITLPLVNFLEGETMPQPQRHLLVHQSDMTPRLREHYGSAPVLTVISAESTPDYVIREVVLNCLDRPVEYGAIGIHLDGFALPVRSMIRAGTVPLGAILESESLLHTSAPTGYFQLEADAHMARLMGTALGLPLFGRCNVLSHADGTVFADIVEVLPPS